MKVAILDMQPIEPAVGGGRLRLLGLYHGLGPDIQATYVGTYDWPGPGYRRHMLSDNLEEIDIPLTDAHFQAAEEAKQRAGGRNVIDCVFHLQAHLSPDYVAKAREVARDADVVVFSHPWIFPLTRDALDFSRQLIVYDSHNVEGALRHDLLKDHPGGVEVAKEVASVERSLCDAADLILACSPEDGRKFTELYGAPPDKIRLIPNGVFVRGIAPADLTAKAAARKACNLGGKPAAIFIGSAYAPNLEAARFIARELAPALPEVVFVIAGGVGEQIRAELSGRTPKNLVITGSVDENRKKELLLASDLALNPMFSGSGTNIKMFDFMAAGLPTVTTPVG
ncbi:MAG: glycosyltransferase family 4 protein, partial [Alphaproteobacteria bacterium]|nr:glycosyltransferase family 4 protein [Alphaproteobacteria bacterium]